MQRLHFLIRSLNRGGAERQLVALAKRLHGVHFNVTVICFYSNNTLSDELIEAGIRVISAGRKKRWDVIPFIRRLRQILKEESPSVIHSYMVASNIVTSVIKLLYPDIRIIWGIRDSLTNLDDYEWFAKALRWAETKGANFPDLIIANSQAGRRVCLDRGFSSLKTIVIENGIDVMRFKPSMEARTTLRQTLGIDDKTLLIGIAGRIDPLKGHSVLLAAYARVLQSHSHVRLLVVGSGESQFESSIHQAARALRVYDRVEWLVEQSDMTSIYPAMDFLCSASHSEGYSNAIAEAMACGLRCVVTNVGDSASIVGPTGIVVPPNDVAALTESLLSMIDELRSATDRPDPRDRIVEHFSQEQQTKRTINAINEVIRGGRFADSGRIMP